MLYQVVPNIYRYHGSEYLRKLGSTFSIQNNLFNIVTNRWMDTSHSVEKTTDTRYLHCAGRVVVPMIDNSQPTFYNDARGIMHNIVVGFSGDVPVDIMYPRFEYSTRKRILSSIYKQPYVVTGNYSVLSRVDGVYSNFQSDQIELQYFDQIVIDAPSKWFHNGTKPVLRFFPNAVKAVRSGLGSIVCPSLSTNIELSKDDEGRWFVSVDGDVEKVRSSHFYDENLLAKLEMGYFISGDDKTILYIKGTKFPFVKMPKPVMKGISPYVTVLKRPNREVVNISRGVIEIETSNVIVYRFDDVDRAHTFYLANFKAYRNNIWYGDLNAGFHSRDPSNSNKILLPPDPIFLGPCDFKFPIKLRDMLVTEETYDPVGRCWGDSSGANIFTAFSIEDDFIMEGTRGDGIVV